ncbi:MAG: hypothetical protein EZS28_019310 [Streblomastix strix]|uniref:Uncharacterized protein n=1 Tax=Streblomastix strix TaxID=222440 RepID=A0A5J4VRK1_9EUKA|nr:MAG: hypothetical protein EZS28_019310 [Streblomastix strix]
MFDADWYNSGDIVPDQVTPACDATPLSDGTETAGISSEYSRGDHAHPLNITTTISPSDSASGSVGSTNFYARNDHYHPLNIITSIPPQNSASGSVRTTNYYIKNDHSHPINVEINASNITIVNGVGDNGTSAFYTRQDHVHPQQLTYDGNETATKFIKIGGFTTKVLCAFGDSKAISDIDSDSYTTKYTISGSFVKKRGEELQVIEGTIRKREDDEKSIDRDYLTRKEITDNYVTIATNQTVTGLRNESRAANRGLQISADGHSLSFNGSVIAGTGATNRATNGSVNYSAGNPILWGVNCVGTEGGFYSNGTNVFWRVHQLTMGSVSPQSMIYKIYLQ